MKTKYCDMCGEREPDYSYKDTICGTTEEIENFVCSFCAEELFQANYGKDEIIYFKRIDGKNLSPVRKMNLWTFNSGKIKNHGSINIDNDGFVNGEYPIEDFGDYLLTADHLSPENAFDRYCKLVA